MLSFIHLYDLAPVSPTLPLMYRGKLVWRWPFCPSSPSCCGSDTTPISQVNLRYVCVYDCQLNLTVVDTKMPKSFRRQTFPTKFKWTANIEKDTESIGVTNISIVLFMWPVIFRIALILVLHVKALQNNRATFMLDLPDPFLECYQMIVMAVLCGFLCNNNKVSGFYYLVIGVRSLICVQFAWELSMSCHVYTAFKSVYSHWIVKYGCCGDASGSNYDFSFTSQGLVQSDFIQESFSDWRGEDTGMCHIQRWKKHNST